MDKFTVRDNTGSVDINASKEKYGAALAAWKTEHEIPTDAIEQAVESVFDRYPGSLPMPSLLGLSVQAMNPVPDQFNAITERVRAYIKGQRDSGRLKLGRAPAGGVSRLFKPGENLVIGE